MDLQKQRRKKKKKKYSIVNHSIEQNEWSCPPDQSTRMFQNERMSGPKWLSIEYSKLVFVSFSSHLISSKRWVRGGKEIQRSDRGDSCRWWSIIGSIQVDPFYIFYMPNPGVRSLFRRWHLCSIPPSRKKRKIMERIRLSYWLITISIISSIKLFFFYDDDDHQEMFSIVAKGLGLYDEVKWNIIILRSLSLHSSSWKIQVFWKFYGKIILWIDFVY